MTGFYTIILAFVIAVVAREFVKTRMSGSGDGGKRHPLVFQVVPKNREEWLRALFFPFQAYVAVAYFVERYFVTRWPPHSYGPGEFRASLFLGYGLCVVVLLGMGICQLTKGQIRKGFVNLGLAVLGAWLGYPMSHTIWL